jgi:hypothetical protein
MTVEMFDPDIMSPSGSHWQAVAEALAGVLQATMLRNPNLTARDWDRAHAALQRYECAAAGPPPS